MAAELEAAEVEGTVSVDVVGDAFEESGEDWTDCTACALAAAVVASEADGSVEVGGVGVVASAEAARVVDDGLIAGDEVCCAGAALFPAPARVFMWLGR